MGVAGGALSEPKIHGTFFVFLQAKLLFSDGKKVVPRLPHEQAVPKVIVVIVHRSLSDLRELGEEELESLCSLTLLSHQCSSAEAELGMLGLKGIQGKENPRCECCLF